MPIGKSQQVRDERRSGEDRVDKRRPMDRRYRIGVDIGGTFTDLVLIDDASGERAIGKVLTTPDDPSEAVEQGLRELLQRGDVVAAPTRQPLSG